MGTRPANNGGTRATTTRTPPAAATYTTWPTRDARIEAARTYIGRVLEFIGQAQQIHDAKREASLSSPDEATRTWWKDRRKALGQASQTYNRAYQSINYDRRRSPLSVHAPSERAAIARELDEIEALGMQPDLADAMEGVKGDPATWPLPQSVTGNAHDLGYHEGQWTAQRFRKRVDAVAPAKYLAEAKRIAGDESDPEVAAFARHILAAFNGHQHQQEETDVVSVVPPKQQTAPTTRRAHDATPEPEPTADRSGPLSADQAKAHAEREWDSGRVDRSAWISREVYVKAMQMEAAGQIQTRGRPSAHHSPRAAVASGSSMAADEANAQASREWAGMSADERSAWIDERTFVRYRAGVLSGKIRHR